MNKDLYDLAKKYAALIDKIEKTKDLNKVQLLEEMRVVLHWQVIELLKSEGLKFKDRDHATRIAIQIANKKL